jgi:steroid 5-alpha reductase family enzyme
VRSPLAEAAGCLLVGGLAVLYAIFGAGWPPRRAAIGFMLGSWGARRAIVLLYTQSSTDGPPLSFWPFVWRALAAALLSSPALVVSMNAADGFSILELVAAAAWIVGFTGEAASDHHRIRRYAFEGLVWLAYAVFAAQSVAQLVL